MSVTVTSYINGTAVSPTLTSPPSPTFRDILNHTAADYFGWQAQQVVSSDRIAACTAIDPMRCAAGSLKITVQPGDNPIGSTGERNEVLEMFGSTDEDGSSGTQYYGVSLYLPSNKWAGNTDFGASNPWCIVLQLHGQDGLPANQSSPAFSLDLGYSTGRFTLNTNGGPTTGVTRQHIDLGPQLYDTWIDFLFKVTWAIDNTGQVTVWTRTGGSGQLQQKQVDANNSGATINAVSTPTLYSDGTSAYNHYWKRGCYRAVVNFTTQFYASPVSRAATMADAAWAAFGQYP